jgi:S1-C subfamily serine protease
VNLNGEVIGINSMKVTHGIGFSIPANYAAELLNSSKEKASPKKYKYLGAKLLSLSLQLYNLLKEENNLDFKLPKTFIQGSIVLSVSIKFFENL